MKNESLIKTQDWTHVAAITPAAISRPEYVVEPQTGSVLDYWRILSHRKLALLACGVLGLVGGVAFTLPQAPVYRATTTLEIQGNKDDAFGMKILNPSSDSAEPADPSTDIQTQIRILRSQSLIERALNRAGMDPADSEKAPAKDTSWQRRLPFFATDNSADSLIEQTGKKLKVTQSGETRVIEVSFDSNDPTRAARFANALTAEFIDQSLEARWEMNRKTSEWLVSQLDDLRGKLRRSEDALQTYARQNGLIFTPDKESVSEEKLRQLQTELSRAQADLAEKQSRSEIARHTNSGTVPEVLDDANLRAMESTLTDLRRQQADMEVTFKPDYTKAKRIHAEIESLDAAINARRAAIVDRVDNELQESERREQLLANAYARQTRAVTDDSERSIQYDMLKHDVDTNRQIYQTMLQRVKESSIASAMKATNVRVIDPAKAPTHPYKPKLPLNSTAGMMFGFIIGAGIIIVRTRTDASVQNPGEAEMLLGIPELGVIPAAEVSNRLLPAPTLLSSDRQPETVRMYPGSSPAIMDSFRSVLASILFAGAKQRQRVLVITSANPAEGKTSTAVNLAMTLANMNRKVLLMDGDIRSPRLHSIFGLDNSDGLTNVLEQISIHATAKVDATIRETSIPNLHVLTSGPALQSGADLLFSTSMPTMIARYREQYDMILIDTPPMLVMPDARVLARVADGVILIARSRKTGREAIQAAYRRFVEDQTPVLGIVLNDWDAKMSAYKYYAGYKDAGAGQRPTSTVPLLETRG
ncbi:MAG: polysaccharide biosynthesis tyrosine autokinase [Acidobacteriaceae bacterium]|nr:polysaccharide biosynthesis tyrosine autokinase [Acidobacteriaceae bacterium]MBV9499871.1 polysaccharide biosynthesis tyrosine autokinase [Acidobacteriaceae bacterium]